MSRVSIEELVGFVSGQELVCDDDDELANQAITLFLDKRDALVACTLGDWLANGSVGWDEGLETYFLQGPERHCDVDGSDSPAAWWGTSLREIESPFMLVAMLNWLFSVNGATISPRADTLSILVRERRSSAVNQFIPGHNLEEVLGHFRSVDEMWCTQWDHHSLTSDYMEGGAARR